MTKTSHQYVIECTLDPEHNNWEAWDNQVWLSYVAAKEQAWKLAQRESEYNRTDAAQDPNVHKIHGFRIVQNIIEIKTETISEFLI